MQDFPQPSPEERARLKREHAHRFPELVTLRLPGDGGALALVPIVIGNPTGTTPDAAPGVAWASTIAQAVGHAVGGDRAQMNADDAILWPDAAALESLRARWHGLNASISDQLTRKIGGFSQAVVEPWAGDVTPEPLSPALEADPRRAWFHLRPRDGQHFAAVLTPPEAAAWRALQKVMRDPSEKHWPPMRRAVEKSIAAAAHEVDGAWCIVPAAQILDRFPGLVGILVGKLAELIGTGAQAELGEL